MTLCLHTAVGLAVWSPEEARSEARRSGNEASAGAAATLCGNLFFFLYYICYDDYIVVGLLLSLPHYKRNNIFSTLEVTREGFLSFFSSFLCSAGIPCVVVVLASLCSRADLMASTSMHNNALKLFLYRSGSLGCKLIFDNDDTSHVSNIIYGSFT